MLYKGLGTIGVYYGIRSLLSVDDKFAATFGLIASKMLLLCMSWHIGAYLVRRFIVKNLPRVDSEGKIILITGCDSGFGLKSALRLNGLGFTVYASCLFPEGHGARYLVQNARFPEKLRVVRMDITKEEEIATIHKEIKESAENNNGDLYGLLNNAGIPRTGQIEWGEFDDHFRTSMDVNALGHVRVCRKFLPLIRASKGRVVNVCSTSSKYATLGVGAYSMAKAAFACFTEILRREMTMFGVKVIEIDPMFYKTQITSFETTSVNLDKLWKDTPADIRGAYGQKYYDACRAAASKVLGSFVVSTNVEEVVDAVEEAFMSQRPNLVYSCMQTSHRPHYWMFCNLYPQELCELFSEIYSVMIKFAMSAANGKGKTD